MLHHLQRTLQFRAAIVFAMIHLGLVASLVALVQEARAGVDTGALYWMIAGIVGLYGGVLAGVFFVVGPALPWVRRARRVMTWKDWVLDDLPKLVALIPVFIALIRAARGAWESFTSEGSANSASTGQAPSAGKPSTGPTPDSYRELADALAMAMEAARSAQGMLRKRPPSDAA